MVLYFFPLTNSTPFVKDWYILLIRGSNNISNMWSFIGTGIVGYIMIPK